MSRHPDCVAHLVAAGAVEVTPARRGSELYQVLIKSHSAAAHAGEALKTATVIPICDALARMAISPAVAGELIGT